MIGRTGTTSHAMKDVYRPSYNRISVAYYF
jgi:hypothetical protein